MDLPNFAGLFTTHIPFLEILLRLGLAVLLGTFIGLDRELRGKPAGLRTHMLVCLAAAAFAVVTLEMAYALDESQILRADPLRVIEAVVTGVAFLGAGTIIQGRGQVRGLTTGVTIWLSGAIGVGCGAGLYGVAVFTVLFALPILTLIGLLEKEALDRGDRD